MGAYPGHYGIIIIRYNFMLFACAFGLCRPKWAYNTMTLASLILDTPLYSCSSIDNVTMEVES